jgi:hypothetical protein
LASRIPIKQKAVDSQRKSLRRKFKDQEEFKRLGLVEESDLLEPGFFGAELKLLYEQKENFDFQSKPP